MKKLTLFILTISILVSSFTPAFAITKANDTEGHWAEADIQLMISAGVVSGYEDNSFRPDNNIAVNEALVLISKLLYWKIEKSEDWDQPYIDAALKNGIINEEDFEDYTRPITREEMCMVLSRAFFAEKEVGAEVSFTDKSEIDDKYIDAVKVLTGCGIVNGFTDGSFGAKKTLTRAEACKMFHNVWDYDENAGEEYVYEKWDVFDSYKEEENSPWKFYGSATNVIADYTPMSLKMSGNQAIYSFNGQAGRPSVFWNTVGGEKKVNVYAEVNASATNKKGMMVIGFTAPRSGSYKFNVEVQNIGAGAFGGNGGTYRFTYAAPNDIYDMTVIKKIEIPTSNDVTDTATGSIHVKLKKGDTIYLKAEAGGAGYADKFYTSYTVETTEEEGEKYYNLGYYGQLSQFDKDTGVTGKKPMHNIVWLGTGIDFAASEFIDESVGVMKKYINKLGMNLYGGTLHQQTEAAASLERLGVPTLPQFYATYPDFFTREDAWERNWKGEFMDPSGTYPAGTGHVGAMPTQAYKDIQEHEARSAAAAGFSAVGYTDFTWAYTVGRGRSGYHEETIAAFKRDLQGLDEGLAVTLGGVSQIYHLDDYIKFYVGHMITPEEMGLNDWSEYSPPTETEYEAMEDELRWKHNFLFDMLVHYEWLMMAQHFGKTANDEGIWCQILPNPEDTQNACDWYFLCALDYVNITTSEFFNATTYLDGAYYHFPYQSRESGSNKSNGIVVECGAGGSAGAYYENEIAYATTYELGATAELGHLEIDWWVNLKTELKNNVQSKMLLDRYQQGLAYAMGYEDAIEDGIKPLEKDFKSITARSIARPWSEFIPYEWKFNCDGNPEHVLSKNGYLFEGVGQEAVVDIDKERVILYSPETPNAYHFDILKDKMYSGDLENVVTTGYTLGELCFDSNTWVGKSMKEMYPEFACDKEEIEFSGVVTDADGNVVSGEVSFTGKLYKKDGWETLLSVGNKPVLTKTTVGGSNLYCVMFDPYVKENYELTVAVYDWVLNELGIEKHWESVEAYGEYLDNVTTKNAVEDMGGFEKNASVRIYKNDDMTVVGVQNPMGRYHVTDETKVNKVTIPYKFIGKTTVRVQLEPDTEYQYAMVPSYITRTVTSDSEGWAELSFENTTHELFYLMPKDLKAAEKLSSVMARRLSFFDAMTIGGNHELEDTISPAVNVRCENASDGVKITLSVMDSEYGTGVSRLEYGLDDGATVTSFNDSQKNRGMIIEMINVTEKGQHTLYYSAIDNSGNTYTDEIKFIVE